MTAKARNAKVSFGIAETERIGGGWGVDSRSLSSCGEGESSAGSRGDVMTM